MGYGSVSYNQYLNDNHAERFSGGGVYSERKKEYVHNNDDPFFLNIMYNVGLGGLILFCLAYIINLKDLLSSIKIQKIFSMSGYLFLLLAIF